MRKIKAILNIEYEGSLYKSGEVFVISEEEVERLIALKAAEIVEKDNSLDTEDGDKKNEEEIPNPSNKKNIGKGKAK